MKGNCKRCGGKLHYEKDIHGEYLACLQCGAEHDNQGRLLERRDPVEEEINMRVFDKRFGDRR